MLLRLFRWFKWRRATIPGSLYMFGADAVIVGDGTLTGWTVPRQALSVVTAQHEDGRKLDYYISIFSPNWLLIEVTPPLPFGKRAVIVQTHV